MANAVAMKKADVATLESKLYEVSDDLTITIPYETQTGSVRINGFEAATEAATGKFTVAVVSEGTPSTTAKGSLYAHWPVYSSGTDCTESSIKGWLHLYIPRVRVTALPGFDNSYKSATTNSVTFSAIDPKRADEKMYDLYYEPLDANGSIVTTPTEGATVSWT